MTERNKKFFSIERNETEDHIVITCCGIKIKKRHDCSKIFPYRRNEPAIAKYKYVHIMTCGIHSVNIINFINNNFNQDLHCFLFPNYMSDDIKEALAGKGNVFHSSIKNIDMQKVKKIVLHGLFDIRTIRSLYKNKKYLSKSYWFIWGGDLYSAYRDKVNDYVRRNVAGILTSFDKDVYKDMYGVPNEYYDVTYPHDIKDEMLQKYVKKSKDYVHIQINNSSDETTLEMLEILAKFKKESIKVTTILSYKTFGQDDFTLHIMKKGYEIFGNKFQPIIDWMSQEEYAKHLADVDIYISNQDRAQGNGNASIICSLGKKVYMKSNTTIYKKYNSIGIKYYDTYEIESLNFKDFCCQDKEIQEKSIKILKQRMKDSTKVKQWGEFFNV